MSTGAQYVVAAYAVIWFLLLAYVVVLGARTARITRELELMAHLLDREPPQTASERMEATAPPTATPAPAREGLE